MIALTVSCVTRCFDNNCAILKCMVIANIIRLIYTSSIYNYRILYIMSTPSTWSKYWSLSYIFIGYSSIPVIDYFRYFFLFTLQVILRLWERWIRSTEKEYRYFMKYLVLYYGVRQGKTGNLAKYSLSMEFLTWHFYARGLTRRMFFFQLPRNFMLKNQIGILQWLSILSLYISYIYYFNK